MRDLISFSRDLAEWRESPVTMELRAAMAKVLARRKRALVSSFLSGREVSEADRRALRLVEEWVADFFESSAEDVQEAMKDDADE